MYVFISIDTYVIKLYDNVVQILLSFFDLCGIHGDSVRTKYIIKGYYFIIHQHFLQSDINDRTRVSNNI